MELTCFTIFSNQLSPSPVCHYQNFWMCFLRVHVQLYLHLLPVFRKFISKAGNDRGEGYSVLVRTPTNGTLCLVTEKFQVFSRFWANTISSQHPTMSTPMPTPLASFFLLLRSQWSPIENSVPCNWHVLYDLSVYFYWRVIFLSFPLVFGLAKLNEFIAIASCHFNFYF